MFAYCVLVAYFLYTVRNTEHRIDVVCWVLNVHGGDVGGSAKKVGLRIKELERLYGIKNGGDRKSEANNSLLKLYNSDYSIAKPDWVRLIGGGCFIPYCKVLLFWVYL